jgi:hypothetical protein
VPAFSSVVGNVLDRFLVLLTGGVVDENIEPP